MKNMVYLIVCGNLDFFVNVEIYGISSWFKFYFYSYICIFYLMFYELIYYIIYVIYVVFILYLEKYKFYTRVFMVI